MPAIAAWLLVALTLCGPVATAMDASATVRNPAPELIEWDATIDDRIGLFIYRVIADDPNGIEDVSHVLFYFIDETNGKIVHLFEDRDAMITGRESATWEGMVQAPRPENGVVYRVELHLLDRQGGRFITDRPYTLIDRTVDDIGDAVGEEAPPEAKERPERDLLRELVPLASDITVLKTPLGFVVWGLGTFLTFSLLWLTLAKPPKRRPEPRRLRHGDVPTAPERAVVTKVYARR